LTKRRSRGDGGLHWNEKRQRWIASVTVGFTPAGKRIVRSASSQTKTGAKDKLKELLEDLRDEETAETNDFTVEKAVREWLRYGLNGRDPNTISKLTTVAETHVIADLGHRKLRTSSTDRRNRNLTADDVDEWLHKKAAVLTTRTLQDLRSVLRRSIDRAVKRGKVKRNVVLLCDDLPTGKPGRQSKSLTYTQANALLTIAEDDESTIGAYIVVSLLSGVRTEEARPLLWENVSLDKSEANPPHVRVLRSVRAGGDTKTKKSRRGVELPPRAVAALRSHKARQQALGQAAGRPWTETGLVFASETGTQLDAHNVRRAFRRIAKKAGLDPREWTPRELRHSYVSLLSDGGVAVEKIALLVGHSGTAVTEKVYRQQIRPVVQGAADVLDRLFPERG
jgi:integrase